MGKNRDRLSIIADILETAALGVTKTRIMFMANLSFNLLEKYLKLVLNAGFIQVEAGKYSLTEHGQEFLDQYKVYHDRYEKVQKSLEALDFERDKLSSMCESDRPLANQDSK